MADIATDFEIKGKVARGEALDMFQDARKKYGSKLDFAAYRRGHDPNYLGINGKFAYGKAYAQDSSAIQAIMNTNDYYKTLYYRDDDAILRLIESTDKENDQYRDCAGGDPACGQMKRSMSELDMNTGYRKIRDIMEPDVMQNNKPFFMKKSKNEQLTFFNTLGKTKYQVKGVDGAQASYNYSKKTHISTKAELKFVAGLSQRTDLSCCIRYRGQPATPLDEAASMKKIQPKAAAGLEVEGKSASKDGAAGEAGDAATKEA